MHPCFVTTTNRDPTKEICHTEKSSKVPSKQVIIKVPPLFISYVLLFSSLYTILEIPIIVVKLYVPLLRHMKLVLILVINIVSSDCNSYTIIRNNMTLLRDSKDYIKRIRKRTYSIFYPLKNSPHRVI